MREPKFKVGDKVKVLRASTDEEHDLWKDSWGHGMDKYIGKVLTVIAVLNTEDCYKAYKYCLSDIRLNFPEFVLQNEIRIGQQLLFSFMR